MRRISRELIPFVAALLIYIPEKSHGQQPPTCNDATPPGKEICGVWAEVPPCAWPVGSSCASGSWPAGAHAVHAVLVRDGQTPYTGKALFWMVTIDPTIPINTWNIFRSHYWDWRSTGDPDQNAGYTPNISDLYCTGQTILSDGRVLAVGGSDRTLDPLTGPHGTRETYLFDPVAFEQSGTGWILTQGIMTSKRWYPTATTLPDARVLTVSGLIIGTPETFASTPERFDPTPQTWTELPSPDYS